MWLSLKGWIVENINWLGFIIMGIVGAVVGHAKAYEAANVQWPVSKHFWSLVRRSFYAGFIGIVIYFAYPYFSVPAPIAFISTGILSVFGSESIDWLYALLKEKIAAKRAEEAR